MTIRTLIGDCKQTLKSLPDKSVHVCITSPPYYALRAYPGYPVVWGLPCCDHEHTWGSELSRNKGGAGQNKGLNNGEETLAAYDAAQNLNQGQFCQHKCIESCPCWLGMLGLEPSPELYIQHLIECFSEVRRVLRDDGTLWVNLGDSYSGSHGNGYKQTLHTVNATSGGSDNFDLGRNIERDDGAKPKDLLMMPARLAIALRNDGWYLRSQVPWLKKNCMPESVRDRPTTAVEYIYLLSKSKNYYYDSDAVRIAQKEFIDSAPGPLANVVEGDSTGGGYAHKEGGFNAYRQESGIHYNPLGRNRRNTDWFFESWQGLLHNEDDLPIAMIVNPTASNEKHYATFPPKLVEPMLKASTSDKGVCPECLNPWTNHPDSTVGWQPTCTHNLPPVAATALDLFGGASTTALCADRLGRDAVTCELSDTYSAMGQSRIEQDAPLFHGVAIIEKPDAVKKRAEKEETPKESTLGEHVWVGDTEYIPLPLFDL